MNLEEARKVQWLDNYPRPVGELFDEGFLNRARLEWAVQKARDPKLREAAKILLGILAQSPAGVTAAKITTPARSQQPTFPIGLTLEQAHNTPWPFPPYKGQAMGPLVDAKQLTLKDLGYAIENAWDAKVKQAAIALSLVRLAQAVQEPAASAGLVQVISGGRSHAERKQLQLNFVEGLSIGSLLTLAVVVAINGAISTVHKGVAIKGFADIASTPEGILGIVVFVGLLALVFWLANFVPDQLTKRLEKAIDEYRLGQEGEERAVQVMLQALDGNWSLFRNVSLPGTNRADIDLVLVGPPGVWVFEVKNYQGHYRAIGDRWEYCKEGIWKGAGRNPSQQARKSAMRLKDFLAAENVRAYVNSVVIWANPDGPLKVENPVIPVWTYDRLADELGNIWQVAKLSDAEKNKIIAKLSLLCAAQNREQQNRRNSKSRTKKGHWL